MAEAWSLRDSGLLRLPVRPFFDRHDALASPAAGSSEANETNRKVGFSTKGRPIGFIILAPDRFSLWEARNSGAKGWESYLARAASCRAVAGAVFFNGWSGLGQGPGRLADKALVPAETREAFHQPVSPGAGRGDHDGLVVRESPPAPEVVGQSLRARG